MRPTGPRPRGEVTPGSTIALAMADARDLEPLVLGRVKRNAVRVPPTAGIAQRLQQVVLGARFSISDLANLVGQDQALSAMLLRYANSAVYRSAQPVTSLQDAITRMGAAEVCKTALSISAANPDAGPRVFAGLRRKWWRRAFSSAQCCLLLAERRGLRADEAFVCGLLHDFGRVVSLAAFEQILASEKDARSLPAFVWEASVDRIYVDVGVAIATSWNLSRMLRAVISSHYQAESNSNRGAMVDLVVTCDAITEVVDAHPHVTGAELGGLAALRPDEIDRLVVALPQIGQAIAAADAMHPIPADESRPVASPEGETPLFEARVQRPDKSLVYRGAHMGPRGVILSGPWPLAEHSVVRASVAPRGGVPVSVLLRIEACVAANQGYQIEGRLFCTDFKTFTAWNELDESLR